MKKYLQITLTFSPPKTEEISELLWQLDLNGITETENGLIIYSDVNSLNTSRKIVEILDRAEKEKIIDFYLLEEEILEDKNWNAEYEENVKISEIGERIVIKPSFKEYNSNDSQKIIITIDPKMSFGTGEHETTKLVLTFLEKYVNKNYKILDVGSGTGILAVASVMLGADFAIAVDNDEWCLLNGEENVRLNNVGSKVEVRLGELNDISEDNFDIITANINKHILTEISKQLVSKMKNTGMLILSGILYSDENEILEIYNKLPIKLIDRLQMNEWIALVFAH
jgi:ribosomal protein L11 methyltransferase